MISFELRLRAVTPLTVGWGVPELLGADVVHAKKLVVTGGKEDLVTYVPGSSVKGALRTSAHRVASAYGFTSCGEVHPKRVRKAHKGCVCDVCRLFGYPDAEGPSPLLVSDFERVGPDITFRMTRVSIDRSTLRAREGALYTMEHVAPGTEFAGVLRVREDQGVVPRLLGLLLLAIAELRTWRFGRRSIVDLRIVDGGLLDRFVEPRWLSLLGELRKWLWVRR